MRLKNKFHTAKTIPALLIKTSTPPYLFLIYATNFLTLSESLMSN